MITLYGRAGVCASGLHIFLEHTQVPYIYKDKNTPWVSEELEKINPTGSVPTLYDSEYDLVLTQHLAIAKYILRKYRDLLKDNWANLDSISEYHLDNILSMITSDIHKSYGPILTPSRITTSTDTAQIEAIRQKWIEKIEDIYKYLDERLEWKNYIVLDRFTPADSYLFITNTWAEHHMPDIITKYQNIVRFQEYIRSLDGTKKVTELYDSQGWIKL